MIWIILAFSAFIYGLTRMIVNIFREEKKEKKEKVTKVFIIDEKQIQELLDQKQKEANMKAIEKILKE